ncbi:MAG: PH domain-containing protein [Gammaproteobacteria bacterium]|nr:PH domain-containing protein [Gammaproteobacteria bacterium]
MTNKFAEWQRVDAIVAILGSWGLFGSVLAILMIIFQGRFGFNPGPLFALVAVVLVPVIQRVTTKFKFETDQVVFVRGLLSRNETVIPFDQIHDIDYVQNPVHRWRKSAKLQLLTSSGAGATLELNGVSLDAIAYLGEKLQKQPLGEQDFDHHVDKNSSGDAVESSRKVLARMQTIDACKLSVIRNPVLLWCFVGAGMFASYMLQYMLQFLEYLTRSLINGPNQSEEIRELPIEELITPFIDKQFYSSLFDTFFFTEIIDPELFFIFVVTLLVLATVLLVLMLGVSLLVSLAIYKDFRLTFDGETLQIRSGAIIHVSRKIPVGRLQLLRTVSTLRHRIFKCQSIYYDSSAANVESGGSLLDKIYGRWLVPLLHKDRGIEILEVLLPNVNFHPEQWEGIEFRAWKRRFKRNLIFVALIGILAWLFTVWIALLALPLIGWLVFVTREYVRRIQYHLDKDAILLRKGWWVRTFTVVPFEKIQGLNLKRTIFDRMNQMATLCLDVAAHDGSQYALEIPYLEEQQAVALIKELADEAACRKFESYA